MLGARACSRRAQGRSKRARRGEEAPSGRASEEARLASMYSFERSLCGESPMLLWSGSRGRPRPACGALGGRRRRLACGLEDCGLERLQAGEAFRSRAHRGRGEACRACLGRALHRPSYIDDHGMTRRSGSRSQALLRQSSKRACIPMSYSLDGNPLHLDPREVNVVKGDGKCASIAAASIVAKVERDALMCRYAESYPEYHFARTRGMQVKPTSTPSSAWLMPHSPQELLHGVHAANAVLARFFAAFGERLRPPTPVRRIAA